MSQSFSPFISFVVRDAFPFPSHPFIHLLLTANPSTALA